MNGKFTNINKLIEGADTVGLVEEQVTVHMLDANHPL